MSWRYAAEQMVCVNLLVGMPHTLRRVVFPALPLRPLCRVRMSVKSSRSMAITDTPWRCAHLTSWLTASLRPPRR